MKEFRQQGQQNNVKDAGNLQQVENSRQKGRQEPRWRKYLADAVVGIVVVAIFGSVLEFLLDLFPFPAVWSVYGLLLGSLFKLLKKEIKKLYEEDGMLQKPRRKSETISKDAQRKWRRFWRKAYYNTTIMILLPVLGCCVGGAVWAQCNVTSRLGCAKIAFIRYNLPSGGTGSAWEDSNDLEDAVLEPRAIRELGMPPGTEEPSESVPPSESEPVQEQSIEPEAPVKELSIDEHEKEVEEKAKKMRIEEPTADWSISEEVRRKILFEDGKYQISSEWTAEQAKQKVGAYIHDLEQEDLVNVFDIAAPQDWKDKVAGASDKDESLVTSKEKDEVIRTRLDAYDYYGKNSLAGLIAEDFHFYALAYKHYNGEREIIINYYMQSLDWLYERLKYGDLTKEERKEILTSIQYRYNDIMTYSEPKTEQWGRAKLLSDTYRLILEDYETGEE